MEQSCCAELVAVMFHTVCFCFLLCVYPTFHVVRLCLCQIATHSHCFEDLKNKMKDKFIATKLVIAGFDGLSTF
jgi:hypothetical protein